MHVYDASGKLTATLLNSNMAAGIHEVKFDGSGLASGVYFYKVTAQGFSDVKKMVLVK